MSVIIASVHHPPHTSMVIGAKCTHRDWTTFSGCIIKNYEVTYRGYPNVGVKTLRCQLTSLLICSMHLCTGLSLIASHLPVFHKSPHCHSICYRRELVHGLFYLYSSCMFNKVDHLHASIHHSLLGIIDIHCIQACMVSLVSQFC